ncbi:MAG: HupE/UreJ family protein [Verrucomicrobiota bacterium]
MALISTSSLFAHARGESYLFLEFLEQSIEGRVEFSYEDLRKKLDINIKQDGQPSEELLLANTPLVHDYLVDRLKLSPIGAEAYQIKFSKSLLFNVEGGWAQFPFTIESGPVPEEIEITFVPGFEDDVMHRGVLVIEKGEWPSPEYEMLVSLVFGPSNSTQILDRLNPPASMTPVPMIWQGILHIWIGIDHILFLLALALPIVLVKNAGTWSPAPKIGTSLWSLLKIVTIFTIAHSITLLLASLEIITLPSRLVESIIAASIILVAINNILGKRQNTSLVIILLLGLFHGLGFASVMGELPFRVSNLKEFILIILGFNFGVELGQIAILVVLFPILFALRKTSVYRPIILVGGSGALILIAGFWFIERAFGL